MACVVKVQNLAENTTLGDLRRTFKDNGGRPADIHITPSNTGKPRIGFVVFRERKEADFGLRTDGSLCRDCRIIVKPSSPKEFDRVFPGKPMLTSQDQSMNNKNSNYNNHRSEEHQRNHHSKDARGPPPTGPGVLRVDNIDLMANPSDIRRFFKDHNARPADIHLCQSGSGKHDGSAFLIFNMEEETANAMDLDGSMFLKKRLSIKLSSPKEFDRYFPRVAMISTRPGPNGTPSGRGRGRGGMQMGNVRHMSPPQMERGRAPGGMRGGRGGGRGGGFAGRHQGEQFFGGRGDGGEGGRGRSRSPINRRRDSGAGGDSFDRRRSAPNPEPAGPINERKFLRISGLPYNASQVDIQEFFRPILSRDIYIIRNVGGKYAGKFNGSALIEFFSEGDARQAMKMDGNKFGLNRVQVVQASKDEIARTIQENKFAGGDGGGSGPPVPAVPDASALNAIAQSNPQVQHLLHLLTATVNTIAGAAAAAVAPPKSEPRTPRAAPRGGGERVDPVINRVASSANINVQDIKLGRVVGLRNLPYSVSQDDILQFFRNYKVLPDSVRIHQLEDGRCSGDAIVCFRGNRDARSAVSELNKGIIGRRKVELFFL